MQCLVLPTIQATTVIMYKYLSNAPVSLIVLHRLDIIAKSLVPMYNVVKRKEMFL